MSGYWRGVSLSPDSPRVPFPVLRVAIFAFCSLLFFFYLSRPTSIPRRAAVDAVASVQGARCSPEDWSDGEWIRNPQAKPVLKPEDAFAASGFTGCASNREVAWHMASDHPDQLGWRGNVSAWDWTPTSGRCYGVPKTFGEEMVTELVEKGGWLLIGDSVTQEHFFSISCSLYPHVIATPDYSGDNAYFDRAWPQNLYLNPKSPLVPQLRPPLGFDMAKTPLVTFRRNDLLFNLTEIETIQNGGAWRPAPGQNSTLFGTEASWNISPKEYFEIFLAPLPGANYRTLIVSTAGHWSLKLFAGLPRGYDDIFDLFRLIMNNWVYQAAMMLNSDAVGDREKEVIVRPYLPGDDACHTNEIQLAGPRTQPLDQTHASYNWGWIPRLNGLFEDVVTQRAHPNVHYVGIDYPGRLRPDAHVLGDCLHITVGAGVIEGWTRYIHYYLTSYIPWQRLRNPSAKFRF